MEFRRVCFQKRIIFLILTMLVLNAAFAWNATCSDEAWKDAGSNAEIVVKQAESMEQSGALIQGSAFSRANIEKTKKDYDDLKGRSFVELQGKAFQTYIDSVWPELLAILASILICYALLDPEDISLQRKLRIVPGGRSVRGIRIVGAIALWVLIIVFFMELGAYLVLLIKNNENPAGYLFEPVQSIAGFENYTTVVCVFVYLILHYAEHVLLCFFLVLFLWFLLFHVKYQLVAGGIYASFVLVEYLLFAHIPDGSVYEGLRYCNIWFFLSRSEGYREYRNLNLFGFAVSQRVLFFSLLIVVSIVLIFVVGMLERNRYPEDKKKRSTLFLRFQRRIDGPNMLEAYKLLYGRRAILWVLAVLALLILLYRPTDLKKTVSETLYESFIEQYSGESIDVAEKEIQKIGQELEKVRSAALQAEEQYSKGLITEAEYALATYEYESKRHEEAFYQIITNQMNSLKVLKKERSIDGELVNLYLWNRLLRRGKTLFTIVLVLFMSILSVTSFWQERKCGMEELLWQCPRGRTELEYRKLRHVWMIGVGFLVLQEMMALLEVTHSYHIDHFTAPVQSVPDYAGVVLPVSILIYMILCLLLRIIILTVAVLIPYGCYCLTRDR